MFGYYLNDEYGPFFGFTGLITVKFRGISDCRWMVPGTVGVDD
jgi:hypothetical protein